MKDRAAPILAVLGLVLVATVTLVLEQQDRVRAGDPTPSVNNPGPRGLMAAFRYLEARGVDVRTVSTVEDFLPSTREAKVLLLPGPAQRALDAEEVEAALEVARRGGTLVYLAADGADPNQVQPALAERLGIFEERRLGEVEVFQAPGRDVSELVHGWKDSDLSTTGDPYHARVRRGLDFASGEAVAGAGSTPAISRRQLQGGWLYVLSTPTFLENHRIDLGQNASLLEGLVSAASGGALYIDESHHLPPEVGASTLLSHPAVLATTGQIALVGLFFLLALGRRFGPIRPAVVDTRRSTLEYVETLASVFERAGVEAALCDEAFQTLRERLQSRAGVPRDADRRTLADGLARATALSDAAAAELLEPFYQQPRTLMACTRALHDVDARLRGEKMA